MTAWRNQNWSGKVYFLWSAVCLGNVVKSRNQFYRWVPLITPITIDGKNKCMTKFRLSKLSFSTLERGVVYLVHWNENLKHFKRESYWFGFSSQNYVWEMGTFRGNFVFSDVSCFEQRFNLRAFISFLTNSYLFLAYEINANNYIWRHHARQIGNECIRSGNLADWMSKICTK